MPRCPRCKSPDVELIQYLNMKAIVCKHCGFDERQEYEYFDEGRSSQKEKGRFSPYKTGGSKRTMK